LYRRQDRRGTVQKNLRIDINFFTVVQTIKGRNEVGIVFDKDLKNIVLCVNRRNNRIISLKIQLEEIELNILSTYAPQAR